MDEGFCYLGEVVFVLYELLILVLEILYFNILFDENVLNYLVIGKVYLICLEGGRDLEND